MGLPPVVVGLAVYLLLSRSGPLGSLGLLFTPTAMVIAQALLITPIIAALTRQIVEDALGEYRERAALAAARRRCAASLTLLWDARFSLVTALLAGFGRAAAEVGAVMIVGGNIDGFTRVMTTAIALETSQGRPAARAGARPRADRARARGQRAAPGSLRRIGEAARYGAHVQRSCRSSFDDVASLRAARQRARRHHARSSTAARRRVLLGANGAGKSMLLRLCHGLVAPDRGPHRLGRPTTRRRAARRWCSSAR